MSQSRPRNYTSGTWLQGKDTVLGINRDAIPDISRWHIDLLHIKAHLAGKSVKTEYAEAAENSNKNASLRIARE